MMADCLFAIKAPNGYSSGDFDIKTVSINGTDTPVLFMAGGRFGRRTDSYFQSCNLLTLLCKPNCIQATILQDNLQD